MKKLFCLLLCACLLAACSGEPAPTQPATTAGTTAAPTGETTQPTEVTQETQPTLAPGVYQHPLTGVQLDAPFTGRITSVVLDNISEAMPQHGLSTADILYEIETEGGITRCLAIFTDFSQTGKLGPVRSSRSFFNNVSVSYDATIAHCGGSKPGRTGEYSDNGQKIPNWAHIDEQANSSYFFRDQDRINSGYNSWDCLFTSGENLLKALDAKGYATPYSQPIGFTLNFADNVDLGGETANTVTGKFRGGKTTTMTYNAETGLYEASQYKGPHIDANTGNTLTYNNVIALYTKQWQVYDGQYYRSFYDLIGSGEGHLACNGKIVPIKWTREKLTDPFRYTLADGTPVTLNTGRTYVGIFPTGNTVQYS